MDHVPFQQQHPVSFDHNHHNHNNPNSHNHNNSNSNHNNNNNGLQAYPSYHSQDSADKLHEAALQARCRHINQQITSLQAERAQILQQLLALRKPSDLSAKFSDEDLLQKPIPTTSTTSATSTTPSNNNNSITPTSQSSNDASSAVVPGTAAWTATDFSDYVLGNAHGNSASVPSVVGSQTINASNSSSPSGLVSGSSPNRASTTGVNQGRIYVADAFLTEPTIVSLIMRALNRHGTKTVGALGSLLHEMTNNHALPSMLKLRYGGLRKFLLRHSNLFRLGNDHPHNPHVYLRDTAFDERRKWQMNSAGGGAANNHSTTSNNNGNARSDRAGVVTSPPPSAFVPAKLSPSSYEQPTRITHPVPIQSSVRPHSASFDRSTIPGSSPSSGGRPNTAVDSRYLQVSGAPSSALSASFPSSASSSSPSPSPSNFISRHSNSFDMASSSSLSPNLNPFPSFLSSLPHDVRRSLSAQYSSPTTQQQQQQLFINGTEHYDDMDDAFAPHHSFDFSAPTSPVEPQSPPPASKPGRGYRMHAFSFDSSDFVPSRSPPPFPPSVSSLFSFSSATASASAPWPVSSASVDATGSVDPLFSPPPLLSDSGSSSLVAKSLSPPFLHNSSIPIPPPSSSGAVNAVFGLAPFSPSPQSSVLFSSASSSFGAKSFSPPVTPGGLVTLSTLKLDPFAPARPHSVPPRSSPTSSPTPISLSAAVEEAPADHYSLEEEEEEGRFAIHVEELVNSVQV